MWMTGLAPSVWETGSWAEIASMVGGPLLRIGLVLGGMISAFGMFNALVMSYSRLPLAMAQDGMLPRSSQKCIREPAQPWVAIIVLAIGWACCLGLGFERLVTIDILVYGASVLLEFVALILSASPRTGTAAAVPVPGGMFWSGGDRSCSDAAARFFGGPQPARNHLRHEFVRLRDDPDGSGRRMPTS